jgi:hypothetical protein
MRWLSFAVVPLILAIGLALVTRPRDDRAVLSPANVSLGAGRAAAASHSTAPVQPSPAPTPAHNGGVKAAGAGPAATKGDGDDFDVRHVPSIDAAGIARVLQGYHSPAVGAAEVMYNLGVHYGIDPAYCLAFFIHESTAGTAGVARTTRSVGNIRATPGYRDYHGYRQYDTWEQGIEDWYLLISNLYVGEWGLTTVDRIVPVYAPSSDGNDPAGYAATVKNLVAGWRNGQY